MKYVGQDIDMTLQLEEHPRFTFHIARSMLGSFNRDKYQT